MLRRLVCLAFLTLAMPAFAQTPVVVVPFQISITNKSGTIASGGSSQVAIQPNPNRVSCRVQPQVTDIFVNPSTTAPLSNSSEYLTVLSEFSCPPGYKGAVAVSGLTTGAGFYADEGTAP